MRSAGVTIKDGCGARIVSADRADVSNIANAVAHVTIRSIAVLPRDGWRRTILAYGTRSQPESTFRSYRNLPHAFVSQPRCALRLVINWASFSSNDAVDSGLSGRRG